jgi:hypothetical protein
MITRKGWELEITDLGSLNGTFINGVRIFGQAVCAGIGNCIHAGGNAIRIIPVGMVEPAWLTWNDGIVTRIAQSIDTLRRYGDLPILHDALLDAGCDSEPILKHLRSPGTHTCGCWVIDLLLGRDDDAYWAPLCHGCWRPWEVVRADACPRGWTFKPAVAYPEIYLDLYSYGTWGDRFVNDVAGMP